MLSGIEIKGSHVLEKIVPQTDLVESVKLALFSAILAGQILPGEKLSQDGLARQLGVSRQPVIQALRILFEQGILCNYGNRGLTVAAMNKNELLKLLSVRSELDCFAVRLAAERAKAGIFTPEDHESIRAINALFAESRVLIVKDKHFELVQNDIIFHKFLRGLSGNEFIQAVLEPHLLHHYRLANIMAVKRQGQIWAQHREIFDEIISGNASSAEALMLAHIQKAEIAIGWRHE